MSSTATLATSLEALIIASDDPLSLARLRDLTDASSSDIRTALGELEAHYSGRGIVLQEVAGGWQFRSTPDCAAQVQQLWQTRPPRLSRSMLETLSIIAYRQPVTRAEIEMLRGLKVSSSIIGGLQERAWIKVLGRKEVPGRPHLYGTGKQFLIDFGLSSLSDLPEIAQLMDQEEMESADQESVEMDSDEQDSFDSESVEQTEESPFFEEGEPSKTDEYAEQARQTHEDTENETEQAASLAANDNGGEKETPQG